MPDPNDTKPRHAATTPGRAEPLLGALAIGDSLVAAIGLGILAVTTIATLYVGVTGEFNLVGILATVAVTAVAASVIPYAVRWWRRGARR